VLPRYLIALIIALFLSRAVAEPEYSSVVELSKQLQTMESLSGQFEQQIKDNRGSVLQQASGRLSVKRPRRFYWRIDQPYEHLVVTDGTTLWLYDLDLEQISKQPFSAEMDQAPALLLSGEIELISQQYTVEMLSREQDSVSFKLTPIKADSLFKVLTISFRQKVLTAMSLQDSFDQLTEISFSNIQLNPAIDDQLFKFVPPAGIDVISNEP
jgi:outer membrane lipoprotein carrier protein